MCTALISVDPDSSVPLLLLFARDEMADRAWAPPGSHWPEQHPCLVGGMDLREGGTWLAVRAPALAPAPAGTPGSAPARVACLLNGLGRQAPVEHRLSRGGLPLVAAEGAPVQRLELGRYDPFHLITAQAGASDVSLLTWDGERLQERRLGPGTHLVSNRGLEAEAAPVERAPERAEHLIDARIRHFRPLLSASARPAPQPGRGTTREAWGAWMRLAEGDGLDPGDVRALIGKHDWGRGQVWLTSSVSLVALGARAARFDVNPTPGLDRWAEVDLSPRACLG